MRSFQLRRLWATSLLLCVPPAFAQTPAGNAAAPVELPYRSVFAAYRGYTDQPVAAWTAANATVGTIGGWRAYARESAGPATADGVAAPPASVPPAGAGPAATAPVPHLGPGGKP